MANQGKFSETMRIDISPDVLKDTVPRGRKGIVISPNVRRKRTGDVPARDDAMPENQVLYHELLQSLYDAALVTDLNGQIVDVNLRAMEFLFYEREELHARNVLDIIIGADASLIQTLLDNLEEERFTLIQAYCQRKDGSVFPAEIAVNKLKLEDLQLLFFVRDITLRRQAEEMLRTEHNAIQNSGNGIAITDLDGRVEYLNRAMLSIWGFEEPGELLGRDIRELWPSRASADELIDLVLREDERAWTCELSSQRQDGSGCELQVSAACNRDADSIQTGIVFSFVDISDRKQAEEARREVERHRVMLESLGAACHHLGQPATVLLANMGIINNKLAGRDRELDEIVASSIEAVDKLSRILHKLNRVNAYRTTQYLEGPPGDEAAESRILDIEAGGDEPPSP